MSSLLAVLAAFMFALAATLQQRGALTLGGQLDGAAAYWKLAKQPWWLAGTGALLLGYAFQGGALREGQLSTVQALLVTTIVFALPLGWWLTNQSVNRTEVVAALLVVLGLVAFTLFGQENTGRTNAPTWEWVVTFAVFGLLAVGLVLFGRKKELGLRAAYLGAAAGILYALSAAMWKPTSDARVSGGLSGMLTSWEFYAWAAAAVVAFVVQQVSLAAGHLASSVATVSVCNPLVSVVIGILVLQETLSDPTWHKVVAFGGLGLALYAAIVITQATEGPAETADPEGRQEAST